MLWIERTFIKLALAKALAERTSIDINVAYTQFRGVSDQYLAYRLGYLN